MAQEADIALVFMASFAREGRDRESLSFDLDTDGTCQLSAANQDTLTWNIAGSGTPTVVIATAPGAMLTPWKDQVKVR